MEKQGLARILDDAVAFFQRLARNKTNWKQYLGSVIVFTILVYFFFSHDLLYFVSFLAEIIRSFGVMLLLLKIEKQKSIQGLSLKSQQLYVFVFATRMLFKVFYEKDYLYAFVEFIALFLTAFIVYRMRVKFRPTYSGTYDTVNEFIIIGVCFLAGMIFYPAVTNSKWINVLWAFSTYMECVALLPQIWIVHHEKRVEDATSHYIASLFLSRMLELAFWVIALILRNYLRMWKSLGTYVIITELIHSLLLSDFIYYYIVSWRKGTKMVLPAMVPT